MVMEIYVKVLRNKKSTEFNWNENNLANGQQPELWFFVSSSANE